MRKRVVTLVGVAALVAGCGGDVGGKPVATQRWDPCSVTPEAVKATGLDPVYRSEGWGEGIEVPDWSLCTLRGPAQEPSYFLNVKSSDTHTIGEARQNESYLNGTDLRIADRDAYRFRTQMSRSITDCNIAVAVPPGVVVFSVHSMGTMEIGADPCVLVLQHATELENGLPPL
ncbi:MAG: DUF3558 family protein [Rhodococcus sp. (in: high G+C Gram-positive bacteria)]